MFVYRFRCICRYKQRKDIMKNDKTINDKTIKPHMNKTCSVFIFHLCTRHRGVFKIYKPVNYLVTSFLSVTFQIVSVYVFDILNCHMTQNTATYGLRHLSAKR